MSAAGRLEQIERRLSYTGYHPAKDDTDALLTAVNAVLALADGWDRVHASMEDYHATDVRNVIEEALS